MRVGLIQAWERTESDSDAVLDDAAEALRAAVAAAGDQWAGRAAVAARLADRLSGWDVAAVWGHAPAGAARAALTARDLGVRLLTTSPEAILLCAVRAHWRAVAASAGVTVPPAVRIWDPDSRLPPLRFPVAVWDRAGGEDAPPLAWNATEVRALAAAAIERSGPPVLAERWRPGRTFAVAVLSGRPLPVLEHDHGGGARRWRCPAAVPPALAGALGIRARRASLALGIDGPGLLHFGWDGQGAPRLHRPDACPDLGPGQPYALAADAARLGAGGVWCTLLDHARRGRRSGDGPAGPRA